MKVGVNVLLDFTLLYNQGPRKRDIGERDLNDENISDKTWSSVSNSI